MPDLNVTPFVFYMGNKYFLVGQNSNETGEKTLLPAPHTYDQFVMKVQEFCPYSQSSPPACVDNNYATILGLAFGLCIAFSILNDWKRFIRKFFIKSINEKLTSIKLRFQQQKELYNESELFNEDGESYQNFLLLKKEYLKNTKWILHLVLAILMLGTAVLSVLLLWLNILKSWCICLLFPPLIAIICHSWIGLKALLKCNKKLQSYSDELKGMEDQRRKDAKKYKEKTEQLLNKSEKETPVK